MQKLLFFTVFTLITYFGFSQGLVKEFKVDGETLSSNYQTALFLSDQNNRITLLKFPRSMKFGKNHEVLLVQFNNDLEYIVDYRFPDEEGQFKILNIFTTDSSVIIFYEKFSVPENKYRNSSLHETRFIEWSFSGKFIVKPTTIYEWDDNNSHELKPLLIDFKKTKEGLSGIIALDEFYKIFKYPDSTGTFISSSLPFPNKPIKEVCEYSFDEGIQFVTRRNNVEGKEVYEFLLKTKTRRYLKIVDLPEINKPLEMSFIPGSSLHAKLFVHGFDNNLSEIIAIYSVNYSNGSLIKKQAISLDSLNASIIRNPEAKNAFEEFFDLKDKSLKEKVRLIDGAMNDQGEMFLVFEARSKNYPTSDFSISYLETRINNKELKARKNKPFTNVFLNQGLRGYAYAMQFLRYGVPGIPGVSSMMIPKGEERYSAGPTYIVKIDTSFDKFNWLKFTRGYSRNNNLWEVIHNNISFSDTAINVSFIAEEDSASKEFKYSKRKDIQFKEVTIGFDGNIISEKVIFKRNKEAEGLNFYRANTYIRQEEYYFLLGDEHGKMFLIRDKKKE